MEQVLLLNTTFEPIAVVSWKKAVTLVFLQKVEVLGVYDREVKSISRSVRLPAVIRLLHFVRNGKRGVKFSRRNVFIRDDFTCQYCGKKFEAKHLTCDHLIPRSRGGLTEWTNIVTSCIRCNLRKGDKLPEEREMLPRRKPYWPTDYQLLRLGSDVKVLPEIWRDYLF
ncbi:MAG TPA: HNH endonuclease [Deltaproteobacteria bacterium]|nr:HNH endonuclease [Deltaproteobacteria bacterium]